MNNVQFVFSEKPYELKKLHRSSDLYCVYYVEFQMLFAVTTESRV